MTTYEPGDQIATPATVYRVERVLGHGGMGSVYDVVDKNLNRKVVLKVAHDALARDQVARDRFKREARAIAQLRHPNVVHVTLLGSISDEARTPFYVMERLEGQSLKAVLVQRPKGLRIDIALEIATQLLRGLDAIHERGIIHRDIKPDNVVLHRNDRGEMVVTLIDFGIMLLLADGARPRELACTLSYAAPEQIRLEELGPWTDIFAVGMILFEMLTGARPYKSLGKGEAAAVARLDVVAPRLSDMGPFPPALSDLVAKMLALRVEDRAHDALALIRDLEKIANALVDLDLHEAVTDQALGGLSAPLVEAATAVRTITQADLANPTDPDGDMPQWMQAIRDRHKRQAVLGYAVTEPGLRGGINDTEPLAPPRGINDTEPMAPPLRADTTPMAPPRGVAASSAGNEPPAPAPVDATDPPRRPLPLVRPTRDHVYVDSSPLPDMARLKAAIEKGRVETPAAPRIEASPAPKNSTSESSRQKLRAWRAPIALDKVAVFIAVLLIVLGVGVFLVLRSKPSASAPRDLAKSSSARAP